MAERAAARSEHTAATVAPAMTDNPAPPAAGSHQNPLHIGSAQAQSHASAVGGDCLTAGSSITASPSTVSRSPARTAFPNPASALQAIPHAVAADTGPQGDNAARDASSHPAQPAACVAEAGVFREEPAGTLPVVQPHPAGTASVTEDDGDNTATERGSSDGEEEEEDSAEQVRLCVCSESGPVPQSIFSPRNPTICHPSAVSGGGACSSKRHQTSKGRNVAVPT